MYAIILYLLDYGVMVIHGDKLIISYYAQVVDSLLLCCEKKISLVSQPETLLSLTSILLFVLFQHNPLC